MLRRSDGCPLLRGMKLSPRAASFVSAAALFVFVSGCASMPEPVAVPTGEPLSIREETRTGQYTSQDKVGEIEYRDSSGIRLGTSSVYQTRTHTYQLQFWNAYQGAQPISDDDLYRITKDEQAEREVRDYREEGVTYNRIGIVGVVVGGLAMGAGYGLGMQSDSRVDPALSRSLGLGGAIVATVSAGFLILGWIKANRVHPLDMSRAAYAVDVYNARLGAGPVTKP